MILRTPSLRDCELDHDPGSFHFSRTYPFSYRGRGLNDDATILHHALILANIFPPHHPPPFLIMNARRTSDQDECSTEVLAREEIRPAPKQLVRRVLSSLLHALSVRQSDVCLVRLFEGAIDFLRRYGARVFVSSVGDRMQVP